VRGVTEELCQIEMRGVPIELWARAQEHSDELLREFALISAQQEQEGGTHDVPRRLLALVEELSNTYSGFSSENERRLAAAYEHGDDTLDLVYEIPRAVGPAASHLADLLDEADDYCRAGEHLLTLATPPDQVRFRRWFLEEFTRQAAGEPARSWAEYAAAG
jgi:hypothetical protein